MVPDVLSAGACNESSEWLYGKHQPHKTWADALCCSLGWEEWRQEAKAHVEEKGIRHGQDDGASRKHPSRARVSFVVSRIPLLAVTSW